MPIWIENEGVELIEVMLELGHERDLPLDDKCMDLISL